MEFTIGQTLYLRFSHYRSADLLSECRILKIGRVWLTLEKGYRVEKGSLRIDGGGYGSAGRAYLSPDQYRQQVATSKAWSGLREALMVRSGAPEGVTAERIQQARELLGLGDKSTPKV